MKLAAQRAARGLEAATNAHDADAYGGALSAEFADRDDELRPLLARTARAELIGTVANRTLLHLHLDDADTRVVELPVARLRRPLAGRRRPHLLAASRRVAPLLRRTTAANGVCLRTMPTANRPRAVWTGAISFGLVNAPVRMYTAISEKDLRFNQLHATDGGRIGYVKVCKVDNEPVPADEIVKGYEISKGEYVQLTDEDLEAARTESHRSITIHDFVPAAQIDPIYFERTYFLGPEEGPGEAIYNLLVQAMERSGLSAIATYVQSDRENLACLRVREGVITLERMFFDDEVRSIDGIAPSTARSTSASSRWPRI